MSYRHRTQQKAGKFVCVADLVMDGHVGFKPPFELKVDFRDDAQWEWSCRAGIAIFYEYLTRLRGPLSLKVTIHDIGWLPVDTNQVIVLFATVEGLCHFFDIQLDKLKVDADKAIFSFPELRSIDVKT